MTGLQSRTLHFSVNHFIHALHHGPQGGGNLCQRSWMVHSEEEPGGHCPSADLPTVTLDVVHRGVQGLQRTSNLQNRAANTGAPCSFPSTRIMQWFLSSSECREKFRSHGKVVTFRPVFMQGEFLLLPPFTTDLCYTKLRGVLSWSQNALAEGLTRKKKRKSNKLRMRGGIQSHRETPERPNHPSWESGMRERTSWWAEHQESVEQTAGHWAASYWTASPQLPISWVLDFHIACFRPRYKSLGGSLPSTPYYTATGPGFLAFLGYEKRKSGRRKNNTHVVVNISILLHISASRLWQTGLSLGKV